MVEVVGSSGLQEYRPAGLKDPGGSVGGFVGGAGKASDARSRMDCTTTRHARILPIAPAKLESRR